MIEKDILHKVTWDAQDPTCGTQSQPQGAPCAAAESGPQPEDPMGPLEGPPVLSLQVGVPCCTLIPGPVPYSTTTFPAGPWGPGAQSPRSTTGNSSLGGCGMVPH